MEPKHLPDLGHGPESSLNDTIMLGVSAGFQVLRLLVGLFFLLGRRRRYRDAAHGQESEL